MAARAAFVDGEIVAVAASPLTLRPVVVPRAGVAVAFPPWTCGTSHLAVTPRGTIGLMMTIRDIIWTVSYSSDEYVRRGACQYPEEGEI